MILLIKKKKKKERLWLNIFAENVNILFGPKDIKLIIPLSGRKMFMGFIGPAQNFDEWAGPNFSPAALSQDGIVGHMVMTGCRQNETCVVICVDKYYCAMKID